MSNSSSSKNLLVDKNNSIQNTIGKNTKDRYPTSRRVLEYRKYKSIDDEEELETSDQEQSTRSPSIRTESETTTSEILPTDTKPVKFDKNLEVEEISISENISALDNDFNLFTDLKEKIAGEEYSIVSYSSSSSSSSSSEENTDDSDDDDDNISIKKDDEPGINKIATIADVLDPLVNDDTSNKDLPPYIAKLLCAIMDEVVDQLDILGCREKPSSQIIKDTFGSLEERLKEYSHEDPIIDTETAVSYQQILKEKEENKIVEDGSLIKEIMIYLRDSIQKTNSYKAIIKMNEILDQKEREEDELIQQEKKNTDTMHALERDIQTEDIESRNKIQELDEQIAELRDKIENKFMENMLRERYCANWAKSLVEQRALKCKETEEGLTEIKRDYDSLIEKEIKANSEIEWYYDEKYKKMEKSHEEWQKKYEEDSESLRADIQVLEEQREEQQKELQKIKADYERMNKEINDYRGYKERKRKEKERLEMLNAKATKIQAWWRGMMVRHKLGPYNPKKTKKGKGKDKKPGKKKK